MAQRKPENRESKLLVGTIVVDPVIRPALSGAGAAEAVWDSVGFRGCDGIAPALALADSAGRSAGFGRIAPGLAWAARTMAGFGLGAGGGSAAFGSEPPRP